MQHLFLIQLLFWNEKWFFVVKIQAPGVYDKSVVMPPWPTKYSKMSRYFMIGHRVPMWFKFLPVMSLVVQGSENDNLLTRKVKTCFLLLFTWKMFLYQSELSSLRAEVFCKKGILKISYNSRKNTCGRVSFLIKLQASAHAGRGVFLCTLQNF